MVHGFAASWTRRSLVRRELPPTDRAWSRERCSRPTLRRSRSASGSLELPREPQKIALRLVREHRELASVEPYSMTARAAVQGNALVLTERQRRPTAGAIEIGRASCRERV